VENRLVELAFFDAGHLVEPLGCGAGAWGAWWGWGLAKGWFKPSRNGVFMGFHGISWVVGI